MLNPTMYCLRLLLKIPETLLFQGFMSSFSFRMAPGAIKDTSYKFIVSFEYDYDPNDTCQLYIANNIFQGNNFSYWIDVSHNFPFFSDYNVIYNFRKYKNNRGNIIGKTHDIGLDPLLLMTD